MYKLIYFTGEPLVMENYDLPQLIKLTVKNKNIHQIVRNNHTEEIVWERECEKE